MGDISKIETSCTFTENLDAPDFCQLRHRYDTFHKCQRP